MQYLVVFIALVALAVKGFCGKRVSGYVRNIGDSFVMNTVRFLLCLIIGFALVLFEGVGLAVSGRMIAICALAGVASAVNIGCWVIAVKSNAMATIDVMSTLGSIIPAVLCAILFNEQISWLKMIGFAFILSASLVMLGYNKGVREKRISLDNRARLIGKITLFLTPAGDCIASFCQQLYKQYCAEGGMYAVEGQTYSKTVYNCYIYIFAAAALAVFFIVYAITARDRQTLTVASLSRNTVHALPFISIMAVCLFSANFLQTVAANDYHMPSQVLYPIMKGGGLVGSLLVGAIFFGEKPNKKSILGCSFALIGIVLMNVL